RIRATQKSSPAIFSAICDRLAQMAERDSMQPSGSAPDPTRAGAATSSITSNNSHAPPKNWQRGFWSLIATQFQGAFNDNALKFLVIYIIVAMNFQQQRRDFLVLVVGALFALPFIFFSMTGGYLADRYSKRSVVIGTKLMEIAVMGVAIAGLALQSLPIECAAVFLISTQSALFGPSKYGLLPELLPEEKLSWGNGIIELGTFIGSITAVMAAGFLSEHFRGREGMAGVILLAGRMFFVGRAPCTFRRFGA